MALSNDMVELQPFLCTHPDISDSGNVLRAWEELVYRSVEAISTSHAGVEDFAEECVYVANIVAKTQPYDYQADPATTRDLWFQGDTPDTIEPISEIVGIIYLKSSSLPSTLDIGLSLLPEARGKRFGPSAIRVLMKWAFEELHCHRIQARIVQSEGPWRDIAVGVFMGLGFDLEGTSRRALFCPIHPTDPYPDGTIGEWRDVTHLAMLDTDWVINATRAQMGVSVVKSRWDELFAKEERDRAELLRLEERDARRGQNKRKRTGSVETLRTPYAPAGCSSSCPSPPPYIEYPFSSDHDIGVKGKGVAGLNDDAMSQSIEAALSHLSRRSPTQLINDDAGWYTPHERGNSAPLYDPGSPALSFTRSGSAARSQSNSDVEQEAQSPVSSSYSAFSSMSPPPESDGDSFSDAESVPRSASVASSVPVKSDADEWEFLETSSVGSSAVWSASDGEL